MQMENHEMTSTDLSLDWNCVFEDTSTTENVHTDSIPDALILSLSNLGRVDIEYIVNVTGTDYMTVINALKGAIFQNPDTWNEDLYMGWETAEEYLSGNLRRKLRSARKANKAYAGRFKDNVLAIRELMPEAVDTQDIYITLGSPWVPSEVIEDFIVYILRMGNKRQLAVNHDEYTGTWEIKNKATYAFLYSVAAKNTYGTSRMDALDILERTLNMRTVAVYDEIRSFMNRSGKKKVINQPETVLALEKQQKLISTFQKWV